MVPYSLPSPLYQRMIQWQVSQKMLQRSLESRGVQESVDLACLVATPLTDPGFSFSKNDGGKNED